MAHAVTVGEDVVVLYLLPAIAAEGRVPLEYDRGRNRSLEAVRTMRSIEWIDDHVGAKGRSRSPPGMSVTFGDDMVVLHSLPVIAAEGGAQLENVQGGNRRLENAARTMCSFEWVDDLVGA